MGLKSILLSVLKEREGQNAKWPLQNHSNLYWLGILTEELGEVAKEVIKGNQLKLEDELVQVAAVAIAWLEQGEAEREKRLNQLDYSSGRSDLRVGWDSFPREEV